MEEVKVAVKVVEVEEEGKEEEGKVVEAMVVVGREELQYLNSIPPDSQIVFE